MPVLGNLVQSLKILLSLKKVKKIYIRRGDVLQPQCILYVYSSYSELQLFRCHHFHVNTESSLSQANEHVCLCHAVLFSGIA